MDARCDIAALAAGRARRRPRAGSRRRPADPHRARASDLLAVAARCATRLRRGFDVLVDVTAVDWWPAEPRFEVVYHLVATAAPAQAAAEGRSGRATMPRCRPVQAVWPSANWLEREVWDLFGVVFEGHGDLRRS